MARFAVLLVLALSASLVHSDGDVDAIREALQASTAATQASITQAQSSLLEQHQAAAQALQKQEELSGSVLKSIKDTKSSITEKLDQFQRTSKQLVESAAASHKDVAANAARQAAEAVAQASGGGGDSNEELQQHINKQNERLAQLEQQLGAMSQALADLAHLTAEQHVDLKKSLERRAFSEYWTSFKVWGSTHAVPQAQKAWRASKHGVIGLATALRHYTKEAADHAVPAFIRTRDRAAVQGRSTAKAVQLTLTSTYTRLGVPPQHVNMAVQITLIFLAMMLFVVVYLVLRTVGRLFCSCCCSSRAKGVKAGKTVHDTGSASPDSRKKKKKSKSKATK